MMLSPRTAADGPRPTLSNFGCFIPRPTGQSGIAAMLSPRFIGPDKPSKPQPEGRPQADGFMKAARKALGPRGGAASQRDGFEIFYGLDPKNTRSRRRTTTAASTTAAPPAPSKVDGSAGSERQPRSDASAKGRPRVPTLQLNVGQADQPASGQRASARRSTAPATASTAPAVDPADPIAAVSSLATAAVAAFSALADSGVAAVDVALGVVPEAEPAPSSPLAQQGPSSDTTSEASRKPRRKSKAGSDEIWTPRGVPVFSLSGQSGCPRAAEEPQPTQTADSYAQSSPNASPDSLKNSTQACWEPQASTANGDSRTTEPVCVATERSQTGYGIASRPIVPALSLPIKAL